jgi:hypothetical protein
MEVMSGPSRRIALAKALITSRTAGNASPNFPSKYRSAPSGSTGFARLFTARPLSN